MLHKLWNMLGKVRNYLKQIRKICYNSIDKSVWLESGVWLFLERMTRAVSINKGGLIESRLFGKLPVAEELFVRFVSQHSLPPTVPTTSNSPSGNGIKKSKKNPLAAFLVGAPVMDSFQSCLFFDQFWIKVFYLSDESCIGVTVLMIVHF